MDPTQADKAYDQGGYVTCPKCGVQHSTLVKHRCFKPKEQDEKPKFDKDKGTDGEQGGGGTGEGGDTGDGGKEGQDQGAGGQPGDGAGEQGEGSGEGKEGDGKAEGEGKQGSGQQQQQQDGEGEGGREAPQPQPPEPETPPVVVVCTVLKFAALCAQCAKNGTVEVSLAEDGLFVYGHNGDTVVFDVIPWGELEKRATLDGEFYVKSVIDEVDDKLIAVREDMIEKVAAIPEAPAPVEQPQDKANPLTLPLKAGQRVLAGNGIFGRVSAENAEASFDGKKKVKVVRVYMEDGQDWSYVVANGKFVRPSYRAKNDWDLVADADDQREQEAA